MWVKASRRLTPGYNSEEFMAAARRVCLFKISLHCRYLLCPTFSLVFQQTTTVDYVTTAPSPCGSFTINTVLLKSTEIPVALRMEKTVIQAVRSMKHESEGGGMLEEEAKRRGRGASQRVTISTDGGPIKPGQGLHCTS